MNKKTVLVSACLLGLKTRYNGGDALDLDLAESLKGFSIVPVCPEQLGGLPTPRPRAEITEGDGISVIEKMSRVMDETGADRTAEFLKGAEEVLKIARLTDAHMAYLKEKSPSCGVKTITKKGNAVRGAGVTTALLKKEGLKIKGF